MNEDWALRAACRGSAFTLFFPGRGDTAGVRAALAVCARCPVRAECLDAHLGDKFGIVGGMSEHERRAERKRRLRLRNAA